MRGWRRPHPTAVVGVVGGHPNVQSITPHTLLRCRHGQRNSHINSRLATSTLSMDFTQLYKQTSFLVEFSKGTQWILMAVDDRLIVRRADSFLIERTWLVEPAPSTHIGWSGDSEYVFGANSKQGVVNVFKITDETWNAKIVTGVEGLARVEWAPDGRSILCFSEWGVGRCILPARSYDIQRSQLRVTVWSLTTGSATYIQFPIHPDKGESVLSVELFHWLDVSRGYCYRGDGRYFILAERHKSKDTIGVYDAADAYRLVKVSVRLFLPRAPAQNLHSTFPYQRLV